METCEVLIEDIVCGDFIMAVLFLNKDMLGTYGAFRVVNKEFCVHSNQFILTVLANGRRRKLIKNRNSTCKVRK